MRAELISIGTELLLGAITDTNATYIAQALQRIGLDLVYMTTVGDNQRRIAEVINSALNRVDVVITSGGLGPTVDDVTREAIAHATGRPLEFRQELLDQIAERFQRFGVKMSDNNRRQAMIPQGATPIENPVGTAPIFILETERGVIMTLPGVPREMMYLLDNELIPWLKEHIDAPAVIKSFVLRTVGIGESQIDARISDLMTASNPTVGLAAHSGQTDIRVTAKAPTADEADALIEPVVTELRRRLGSWIYGTGQDRIEDTVIALLQQHGATLTTLEAGTGGLLLERLREASKMVPTLLKESVVDDKVTDGPLAVEGPADQIEKRALVSAEAARQHCAADYALAVLMHVDRSELGRANTTVGLAVAHASGSRSRRFGWSNERPDGAVWASTHGLALLRRMILNVEEPPN